jgi:hypothetical protein
MRRWPFDLSPLELRIRALYELVSVIGCVFLDDLDLLVEVFDTEYFSRISHNNHHRVFRFADIANLISHCLLLHCL